MNILITRPQLQAKKAVLAQNGIVIDGDSGTVDSHGVTVDYTYDGETLALTVVKKPFFCPESAVEDKLREFFA